MTFRSILLSLCTLLISGCAVPEAGRAGSGHFTLSYGGDSANLVKIPYGTSALEMQERLNSNPTRAADGPVNVRRKYGSYIITDVTPGPRKDLRVVNDNIAGIQSALSYHAQTGNTRQIEIQKIDFIPERPRIRRHFPINAATNSG